MPDQDIARFTRKIALPGTLHYLGEERAGEVKITVYNYSESACQELQVKSVSELQVFKDLPTTTWVNVDGIHNVEVIEQFGKMFEIHPLIVEDIVHTGQRPKVEDFGSFMYVVVQMLRFDERAHKILPEQVSIIFNSKFIILFQEAVEGDVFNPVRERIKSGKGKIRQEGSDYLLYSILDCVVDNYFVVLEKFGEEIEELEEELLKFPRRSTLEKMHIMKRELLFLRKSVWPLREVIGILHRGESKLIKPTTAIHLRDIYDHSIQVMDTIESFRDMLTGMLDIYLSSVSNRLNEVMKVLTIISTVFIPITFIAGVYGMNFRHMPELEWDYGYYVCLFIMFATAICMLIYFKRRRWLT